jgi:hypothetical protein
MLRTLGTSLSLVLIGTSAAEANVSTPAAISPIDRVTEIRRALLAQDQATAPADHLAAAPAPGKPWANWSNWNNWKNWKNA